jgi:hypothetical protein
MSYLTSQFYANEVVKVLSEHIDADAAGVVIGYLLWNNDNVYDMVRALVRKHYPCKYGRMIVRFEICREEKDNAFKKSQITVYRRMTEQLYRGSAVWMFADEHGLPDGVIEVWCEVGYDGRVRI